MAEERAILVLRLEGVMQAWGESAKWDFRDSANLPTKSGVVGLLACAIGLERENPEIAALSQAVTMAVRADRPGRRMIDYQTVTGNPLRNAEGKKRSLGNTFISERCYLQDASFLVVLETTSAWRKRIVEALKAPRWPVYLGRKCCVPSRPVLECADPPYETLLETVEKYPLAERRQEGEVFYECELPLAGGASLTRPDQRIEGERAFVRRRVWRSVKKETADVSDKN